MACPAVYTNSPVRATGRVRDMSAAGLRFVRRGDAVGFRASL